MGWLSSPKAPNYQPLADAQLKGAEMQAQAMRDAMQLWKEQHEQTREDFAPFREHGLSVLDEITAGMESGRWASPEFQGPEWDGGPEWDPSSINLEEDPGYQFRMSEGLRATRRALAAQSGTGGGATLKALTRYGQGLASQEYGAARQRAVQDYGMRRAAAVQDYGLKYSGALDRHRLGEAGRGADFARLAGQLGVGYGAHSETASSGAGAASNVSNLGVGAASAIAAGNIGAQSSILQGQIAHGNAQQQGFNNLLNLGGLGYMLFSDRSLKDAVEVVGELDNGLKVYKFRMGDGPEQIGLMADDVEKVNPGAVADVGGLKAVDYGEAVKRHPRAARRAGQQERSAASGKRMGRMIRRLPGEIAEHTPKFVEWAAGEVESAAREHLPDDIQEALGMRESTGDRRRRRRAVRENPAPVMAVPERAMTRAAKTSASRRGRNRRRNENQRVTSEAQRTIAESTASLERTLNSRDRVKRFSDAMMKMPPDRRPQAVMDMLERKRAEFGM